MAQALMNVSWREMIIASDAVMSCDDGPEASIDTKQPMPVGTMLWVTPVDTAELKIAVRVVAVHEAPDGNAGGRERMTVAFAELESAREQLKPHLREHPRAPGADAEASSGATAEGAARVGEAANVEIPPGLIAVSPAPADDVGWVPADSEDGYVEPAEPSRGELEDGAAARGGIADPGEAAVVEVDAGLPPSVDFDGVASAPSSDKVGLGNLSVAGEIDTGAQASATAAAEVAADSGAGGEVQTQDNKPKKKRKRKKKKK